MGTRFGAGLRRTEDLPTEEIAKALATLLGAAEADCQPPAEWPAGGQGQTPDQVLAGWVEGQIAQAISQKREDFPVPIYFIGRRRYWPCGLWIRNGSLISTR